MNSVIDLSVPNRIFEVIPANRDRADQFSSIGSPALPARGS